MLRSDLFDYNDTYIVVRGDITIEGAHNRDRKIGPQHLKIMHHLFLTFQR